jgi:hypothetical protein
VTSRTDLGRSLPVLRVFIIVDRARIDFGPFENKYSKGYGLHNICSLLMVVPGWPSKDICMGATTSDVSPATGSERVTVVYFGSDRAIGQKGVLK